jgi:hypothetical protein
MTLKHVTYVSSATKLLSRGDLTALLETSRVANERDGITGMLLYKDGNLMQTIEGPAASVDALVARLRGDPRHTGLEILLAGEREERVFDGWQMGFSDLGSAEARALPGYSEFLDTPLTSDAFGADPTTSQRLLLSFKRNMTR